MATEIIGKCTGSSGTKYKLWLNVKENSKNIKANKTNLTLRLYLKRNDGYRSSAYNLTESQNSASISVGGKVKAQRNLKIDTRNGETVLLCSYTGDFIHSPDGSLKLNIEGSFTMGNSSLTGGSLKGEYSCIKIERPSTAEFSTVNLYPTTKLTVTINAPLSDFSHILTFKLGSKSTSITLFKGVKVTSFTVPSEWAAEITKAQKSVVISSLRTYLNGDFIGERVYKLNFVIPNNNLYKPDFDIELTRVNNKIPESMGVYVKGISDVIVTPKNVNLKYGATLSAVTITCDNVSKRTSPAAFNLLKSGEVKIYVTLRDSRGLYLMKETSIFVEDYEKPSIKINEIKRCTEKGTPDALGNYIYFNYTPVVSSLNGKNTLKLSYKYKEDKGTLFSGEESVGVGPVVLGSGQFNVSNTYKLVFLVRDSISGEPQEISAILPSGSIPFNIRKGGLGASFGKFSEQDKLLDVGWNLSVQGSTELKGPLKYETVLCESTENSINLLSQARYYPCFNMCFLRIKLQISKELLKDSTYSVCKVKSHFPGGFMPLSVMSDLSNTCILNGGILYESGNVVIRSDKNISKDTAIYISGFYIADFK